MSFKSDTQGIGDWRLDDPNPPTSGGHLGNRYAKMLQRDREAYEEKFEKVVRLAVRVLGWRVVTDVINRVRDDAAFAGR
jgi:hypothetical protein